MCAYSYWARTGLVLVLYAPAHLDVLLRRDVDCSGKPTRTLLTPALPFVLLPDQRGDHGAV